jgi:hypothetical protein
MNTTGKSFLIDCLVTEACERYYEKNNARGYILIVAPTGKAALQAGGFTIQSNRGLQTPVSNQSNYEKNILSGRKLQDFQKRLNYQGKGSPDPNDEHIIGLVMDEYSMISSEHFFWCSHRVQQGIGCDSGDNFGNLPTIVFGDPGQLAPIGGSSIWSTTNGTGRPLGILAKRGHQMYMSINTVMCLTYVRRQTGFFREFLLRLRNGVNTEDDWQRLNTDCSTDGMSPEKLLSFEDINTTFLYPTNAQCIEKNYERLISLQRPILLLCATHDEVQSESKPADLAQNLLKEMYTCVGAKTMLLRNLALSSGLVNGSTGTIIDFVFTNTVPPAIPAFVIIDFAAYTGPAFFKEEGRKTWVPLPPSTAEWYGDQSVTHSRTQFPIQLAWALTTWKAQGMTISGQVFAPFAESEKSSGLSYVALSRLTEWNNLCIGKSIPLDRLTTKIRNCKGLLPRIHEDNRLRDLCNSTKLFFE